MRLLLTVFAVIVGLSAPARADEQCLLVTDLWSGARVIDEGTACDARIGPASTFKFVLAVIGYDAGILVDAETPAWPYRAHHETSRAVERETTTPARWMRESVLWYSREIVAALGAGRFADYLARLGYGNGDVSGDPGAANGMTHAWLNSSLLVSPSEQLAFVRGAALGTLPVSQEAIRRALAILPTFEAGGGWLVRGKTGTGYAKEADGRRGNRQFGWFIGVATHADGRALAFATLRINAAPGGTALGPRVRDGLLARWATIAAAAG